MFKTVAKAYVFTSQVPMWAVLRIVTTDDQGLALCSRPNAEMFKEWASIDAFAQACIDNGDVFYQNPSFPALVCENCQWCNISWMLFCGKCAALWPTKSALSLRVSGSILWRSTGTLILGDLDFDMAIPRIV